MVLVLAVLGSGCGGNSDTDAQATPSTAAETTPSSTTASAKGDSSGPTEAVLKPVDGSEASGTFLFLPKRPSRPARMEIRLDGLEPSVNGGQYVLWLMASRHEMVPIYTYPAGKNGVLAQEWKPNLSSVGYIEEGAKSQLLVTRANTSAEQQQTLEGGERAYDPPFIGEPTLRGRLTSPTANQ